MKTPAKSSDEVQADTRFFGHPLPLAQLFGLEMWERFSYYGMQGILAIYLYFSVADGGLGYSQTTATAFVGAYGGAVFLATILGSWIADRVLSSERVLFSSAIIIVAGHVALAIVPGFAGVLIGTGLVALGSGGLKATASAIVGTLYSEKDPRRDAGFSLFYLGINIGALLGPLIVGLLQDRIGFHIGFGAAAVGMALGLIVYMTGRKNLPADSRKTVNPLPRNKLWILPAAVVAVGLAIWAVVALGWLTVSNISTWIAGVSAFAAIVYFTIMTTSKQVTSVERSRVFAFIPFFLASVVFWALYQQIFGVLVVYSDESLNRSVFGWEMPISWVTLIPAAWVILLSMGTSALWLRMGDKQPSTMVKAGLALVLIGVAFLLFIPFSSSGTGDARTPLLYMIFLLMLFVVAELLISPIGLSAATRLAPRVFRSQMIALFFLASGVGTSLAGVTSQFYAVDNQLPYWMWHGIAALVFGVIVLAAAKPVTKLMKGVR